MNYPWAETLFKKLTEQVDNDVLSPSILISGASGSGKIDIAQQLAQYHFCSEKNSGLSCGLCQNCTLFTSQMGHPDHHTITVEDGKQIIGVDAIRDLVEKAQQKPHRANFKIFVVENAEKLNVNAANALLKVIEEPTSTTYFILTTSHIKRLIPTILSRCQVWKLPTLQVKQSVSWLMDNSELNEQEAIFRLSCVEGPLEGVALTDGDMKQLNALHQMLGEYSSKNHALNHDVSLFTKDCVGYLIQHVLSICATQIKEKAQPNSYGSAILLKQIGHCGDVTLEKWFQFYKSLIQLNKEWQTSNSISPALLIERILFKWQSLC